MDPTNPSDPSNEGEGTPGVAVELPGAVRAADPHARVLPLRPGRVWTTAAAGLAGVVAAGVLVTAVLVDDSWADRGPEPAAVAAVDPGDVAATSTLVRGVPLGYIGGPVLRAGPPIRMVSDTSTLPPGTASPTLGAPVAPTTAVGEWDEWFSSDQVSPVAGTAPAAPALAAPPTEALPAPAAPAQATGCGAAPATLSVASYNILGAGSRFGGGYDLSRVSGDLAAWDVDVAILQEVYRKGGDPARKDQPAQLGAALDMAYAFGFNARKGPHTEYGTAILSRYPIVDRANTLLPNRNGLEQRGVLRATIEVGGRNVDVFDTHLQPGADDLKVTQARSVADVISGRRAATGNPALLGGDFNSIPTGNPAAPLTAVLRDTWAAVGVGSGFTHPARRPNARIDRLYHSAGLTPVSTTVRPSKASDHNAVSATYRLPGTPACS